jgi:RHS repeat-associated protein
LAQQQRQDAKLDTTLLATDLQRSVLQTLKGDRQPKPIAYSPYGHRPGESGLSSLLGFNGERPDPLTGHYLLGNGYRAFNPVLMRFNSPDILSAFDRGGINAYAYCLNDPVNRSDPNGHFSISSLFKPFNFLKRQITRPYYQSASQSRSAARAPLTNMFDDPLLNIAEDRLASNAININKLKITHITSKKDLNNIKLRNHEHKYILTKSNDLFVGSFPNKPIYLEPSHSALARTAGRHPSVLDARVVSAGAITRTENGFQVTNYSGHYQPPSAANTLVKFKLRSLGVSVTSQAYKVRS